MSKRFLSCTNFNSIDATNEATEGPMLGRLVNHGVKREINVKLSVIDVNGTPALCLFACRDVAAGEELLYDYGVKGLPWEEVCTVHH